EISDLGSLPVSRDENASRPRLDGRISGAWSFENGAGKLPRFDLSLRAGTETQLAVTDSFRKPAGEQFTLDAGVTLDAKTATLTNMLFDLNLAGGRIGIENASLQFVAPNDPAKPDEIRLRGKFNITKLDKLLACCPVKVKTALQADGDIGGVFTGFYSRVTTRMTLEANLSNVAVSENDYFVKPAGDNLILNLGAFSVASKTDELIVNLAMDTASLRVDLQRSQNQNAIKIAANFDDFHRVAKSSGFVRRQLRGGDLQGNGQIDLNATFDTNMNPNELYFRLNSPDLTFIPAGDEAAFVIQHKPVLLLGVNKFESRGCDAVWLKNGRCDVRLGKSKGQITYANLLLNPELIAALDGDRLTLPLGGTEKLSGTITGQLNAAELLGDILGPLTQITREHKLRGTIGISGTFGPGADGEVLLQCEIPTSVTLANFNGYSIPAGASPHLDFTLTAPRDASELQLREFSLNMGDVRVELSGKAAPVFAPDGTLQSIAPSEFHAAISADAKLLAKMIHELRNAEMAGGLFLDMQWKSQTPTTGSATNTTFFANDFRGKFRDKQVRLDGELFAKNVRFKDDEFVGLDRLMTKQLEFQVGDNHGWIIADIDNIFADYKPDTPAPKGKAVVLLEYLDDKDIADWLSTTDNPSVPPISPAAPKKKLEDRAVDIIAQLRNVLQSAELRTNVYAKRLRTFDPTLNEHYDVDMLDLEFTATDGNLRIDYIAGLYGGTVQASMTTQIRDVIPQVASKTEMLEVAATPEIRPQISRIFPGNTVTGMFSRWETVRYPLAEMVCNTLDKSFPLTPEGETKLIAIEGIVIGRAAPKFVTKIFPGLNLSEYKYDKMTSFGQLKGDGSAENETIFSGLYDLYMDGVTDKENRIKYTIGLVMLGTSVPAEWHHDWKQGRFPLLNVSGQIRDGQLVDDTVAYPWPTETFYEMCVRYNIVYMAWINAQKNKEATMANN
ncbi:MAG: hypothetical protein KAR11_08595, partial [Phycisphaerae bacterium]|nr:hypothetical protein [Phycisphaerae bacterium]